MPRRRRPLHVAGLAFIAAVASAALAPVASMAQTPIPDSERRPLAAVAPGQSGEAAAFPSSRRCRRLLRIKRRLPILSPRRHASARRRSMAARPASAPAIPASIPRTGRGASVWRRHPHRPAPGAPVPETTFAPLPVPAPPAALPKLPVKKPAVPPGVYPVKAAARARRRVAAAGRAAAGQQPGPGSASLGGGKPAGRCRAGTRRPMTPMQLRPHRRPGYCRPTPCRSERCRSGRFRSPRAIPMRRSAFAPARSCCCLPSSSRPVMIPIRSACQAVRPRRTSSWRRNCTRSPTGRAIRSPPISSVPIPSTAATS